MHFWIQNTTFNSMIKMKIALYLPNGVYGGGERVIITLAREFQKHGLNVTVYTRDTFDYNLVPARVVKLNTSINKVFQICDAARSLKSEGISHIIIFGTDTIMFWASKLVGVKYVYSLRIDPKQVDWSKFMYNYVIHHCYKLVFQTRKVQSFFDKQVQSRSKVIFNPILDENLPDVQTFREKKIVMVGRLSPEKNYSMALNAFAKIYNKQGYTLHIYGVGPLEQELKELIVKLGISDSVKFEGQVKRIVDHIKNASIFILTSNFEGMPNALIEGMAMGMACISADFPSGAAPEIITDGVDGFVVPMNDVDALSNRLQLLIDDDALRASFQNKAVAIRQRQNIDEIVSQWIEFIQ